MKIGSRRGFSMVEVAVGLSLTAIIMTSVAALMLKASRRSVEVSGRVSVNAAMIQHANRLFALPYDSLALGTSCKNFTTPFAYSRCVRVDSTAVRIKKVTLTVTPTNTLIKADSQAFDRAKPVTSSPLNK